MRKSASLFGSNRHKSFEFFLGAADRDPGLDFLRAFAVCFVMLRHFLDRNPGYDTLIPKPLSVIGLFGWSGVDLFFVLSGYLIFSIIFEQEAKGAFRWTIFYWKRILRIWPAYFVSIAICFATGISPIQPKELLYFVSFVQNYIALKVAFNGGVYWSIAVEEHFYIIAPLLLVASARFREWRLHLLLALIILPPIIRMILYLTLVNGSIGAFYTYIYFPTHARFDTIAIGVLCAYVCRFHGEWLARQRHLFPFAAIALGVLAFISTEPLSGYNQNCSFVAGVFGFSLTAAFWATVLLTGQLYRIFDSLGRGAVQVVAYLSYSMYLYHVLVLSAADAIFASWRSPLPHFCLFLAGTVAVSAASYLIIERPFLRLKQLVQKSVALGKVEPVPPARAT